MDCCGRQGTGFLMGRWRSLAHKSDQDSLGNRHPMNFTPLRFQSALAAGGLAWMPFVLMQFTFPRQGKLISVDDLAGRLDLATLLLVAVMLVCTLLHVYLVVKASREFMPWRQSGGDTGTGMKGMSGMAGGKHERT